MKAGAADAKGGPIAADAELSLKPIQRLTEKRITWR